MSLAPLVVITVCSVATRAFSSLFEPDLRPLVFEARRTAATDICPEPCFQVRIYLEDPTRSRSIQAIQFEIDVGVGARVGPLAFPPATNSNASAENAFIWNDSTSEHVPWGLAAFLGPSPNRDFDVLLVLAANDPFDLDSLAALRTELPNCQPERICEILDDADARDLLYLASFKVSLDGDPQTEGFELRVGNVQGVGALYEDLRYSAYPWAYAFVPYPAPEPSSLALLGTAAVAGTIVRARARARAPRRTRSVAFHG